MRATADWLDAREMKPVEKKTPVIRMVTELTIPTTVTEKVNSDEHVG
jgi:hypothetical protein